MTSETGKAKPAVTERAGRGGPGPVIPVKNPIFAGMKRIFRVFLVSVLLVAGSAACHAQRTGVREEVRADWNKSAGLDCLYDCSPQAATPAPKGYEPVYLTHYGRHGSRYAYTSRTYTELLDMLEAGAKDGNLTDDGAALREVLGAFWETAQYRVGDLTPKGWEQHRWIAGTMVRSFPSAFRKGSRVDACASTSIRSILSMGACCLTLAQLCPDIEIYEHQGLLDVQVTAPNMGRNPFRYEGSVPPLPWQETAEEFFLRTFPEYTRVLARLFKDPEAALGDRSPFMVFFHLYMLVAGMESLPDDVRIDVGGIFEPEEFATMWEVDNFERFREYYPYQTACAAIVDDMVAKAEERLAAGSRGADLRFGHDHCLMTLLMLMDIDGAGHVPDTPDDLVYWFQTFRSPMATNLQLVFYTPKRGRGGDILVKLLLNGGEARFGDLVPAAGPYYRWADLKAYLKARTDLFVTHRPARP